MLRLTFSLYFSLQLIRRRNKYFTLTLPFETNYSERLSVISICYFTFYPPWVYLWT